MAYETKPNTGALFKNDKQGNDRRPDYTGTCAIGGDEYRISAWINTSKNGSKYMSLNFQLNEKTQPTRSESTGSDYDEDVPF